MKHTLVVLLVRSNREALDNLLTLIDNSLTAVRPEGVLVTTPKTVSHQRLSHY